MSECGGLASSQLREGRFGLALNSTLCVPSAFPVTYEKDLCAHDRMATPCQRSQNVRVRRPMPMLCVVQGIAKFDHLPSCSTLYGTDFLG